MDGGLGRWGRGIVVCGILAGMLTPAVVYLASDSSSSLRELERQFGHGVGDQRLTPSGEGFAEKFRQLLVKLEEGTPFENVSASVRTVGSSDCVSCHQEIADKHSDTGMGSSLTLLSPDSELPPDAVIRDQNSRRAYRVIKRDGQMWHQELLTGGENGQGVVAAELPVKWQIGSGRHSRSYLIEADGFLIESPVTWYSSRGEWGMSPGFDHPNHPGFGRIATAGCLYCHAGDARPMDGTSHRLSIHEGAIGCERCHGAGELHVKRRKSESASEPGERSATTTASIDYSIVNPRHLDRDLSDSICGQCHLRSAATVLVPGARFGDFRPGIALSDIRADYRLEPNPVLIESNGGRSIGADRSMTVVGHIEQLQLSRCYQNSELSCVMCHDPHGGVSPENAVQHFCSVCLQCHNAEDCHVSESKLNEQRVQDDCTICHMPRTGTDIPHFTFTHHRIGLHSDQVAPRDPSSSQQTAGVLVPIAESEVVPKLVKDAMLGLAYLEFAGRNEGHSHAEEYRQRAYTLLKGVWHQGERSAEIASGLVALGFENDVSMLTDYLQGAAGMPEITADMRVNFLLSKAFSHADQGRFAEAAELMSSVVEIRRAPMDWQLLGDFSQAAGEHQQAAEAFEKALRISPLDVGVRKWLVSYYEKKNDRENSERHARILSLLSRNPH